MNTCGHPVWLLGTFVDPHRFEGTCCKAAGWVSVGHTRGLSGASGRHIICRY
ncbi:MAG: hypothetical protein GX422_08430 [Deltaproteobacteria bacterium]|nr:hypothetical protein [Deltaproteobacteria bacterium]